MTVVFVLMGLCLAAPALGASNELNPDSGEWAVDINASGARVGITGMAQPSSTVQVTVRFVDGDGLATESSFPVKVTFLAKTEVFPSHEHLQVRRITFQCIRGKVKAEALPSQGSGGRARNYW